MLVGITWGQFGLLVLIALILYYGIIISIYYRAELWDWLRKSRPPANLTPSPAATAIYAAVGDTADYGKSFSASPGPDIPPPGDTEIPPASGESGNEPEQPEDFMLNDESWEEEGTLAAIPEPDEALYFRDEINLEAEFIPFEGGDSVEFVTGGMVLADLSRTVALLTQAEITATEKGELSKNLEMMEDTLLLQTLMTDNDRAKARVELLLKEALWEEEPPGKAEPVIKDPFSDLDVKKLLKQVH